MPEWHSMESLYLENLFCYYPDAEDELRAVDDIVYPELLEQLNQAKIDYNMAASPNVDLTVKNELVRKYFLKLMVGNLVESEDLLRSETYVKRPNLALVREHACHLTIAWLKLITVFDQGEPSASYMQWANKRIASELEYLRDFCSKIEDVRRKTKQESMGFAKTSSKG